MIPRESTWSSGRRRRDATSQRCSAQVDRDGGIATQVDNFKLPYLDPSGPTRNIVRPNNRELSQEDWPDLLVGGAKLFRLIPSKSMKDFQAPAACLYNKTSKDYVLAVGKALERR